MNNEPKLDEFETTARWVVYAIAVGALIIFAGCYGLYYWMNGG